MMLLALQKLTFCARSAKFGVSLPFKNGFTCVFLTQNYVVHNLLLAILDCTYPNMTKN